MRSEFSSFIFGEPQPKGSMHSYGNGYVVHSNKSKQWEKDIINQLSYCDQIVVGAVKINLIFYLSRPKSVRKRLYPYVRPDLDKLIRAVLDAITGVIIKDDAQVVDIFAKKLYVTSINDMPGVEINIKTIC